MTGHDASARVVVEADGGARGNPGPAGYGAVVRDGGTGAVLAERSVSIGVATNNVAEYSGLVAGLAAAKELGARRVDVRMDSRLVVEQMAGRWQIKHPGLRPLAAKAAALIRDFDEVTFTWVPREKNRHADALANAAMDAEAGRGGRAGVAPAVPGGPAVPAAGADPTVPVIAPAEPRGRIARTGPPAVSWEPPAETPTRLILVRHGETAFTAERRYSGRGDVELSARGLEQARAAGARLARLGVPVAAVVTSPLARAAATAREIAAALDGVPVIPEPDLIECDFGEWEGRTFAEIRQRWPDEMAAWLAAPNAAPPGGESLRAVAVRVRRVVRALLERYPGQTVVVVSHVSPIKLVLRDALGGGDALLHRLYLDPAGISTVDRWASGAVAVRTVNETAHLA